MRRLTRCSLASAGYRPMNVRAALTAPPDRARVRRDVGRQPAAGVLEHDDVTAAQVERAGRELADQDAVVLDQRVVHRLARDEERLHQERLDQQRQHDRADEDDHRLAQQRPRAARPARRRRAGGWPRGARTGRRRARSRPAAGATVDRHRRAPPGPATTWATSPRRGRGRGRSITRTLSHAPGPDAHTTSPRDRRRDPSPRVTATATVDLRHAPRRRRAATGR